MTNNETRRTKTRLAETIHGYLEELCVNISNRHVGSPGNRAATDFFAQTAASFGFETQCPEFECIDWAHGDVHLQAGEEYFRALVSPYSLSCQITAPLVEASTLDELDKTDMGGKILVIHGELAKEQLMPKEFPFYNPDTHRKIVNLLEQHQPAAIISATKSNPELVGAVSPFPLIEDGDFNIPSVYMTDEEGKRLRTYCGTDVALRFESRRIPARGCNVIARKGPVVSSKLVFCAHIDTKKNTPGALDNATGVATLLALAELLTDYAGFSCIEIVAFNGEDYYAASGQIQYLALNEATFEQILLAVNLDEVGYHDGSTSFSLYECPEAIAERVRKTLAKRHGFYEGEPWPQSDHMIFVSKQRPALAFTSEKSVKVFTQIAHTERDTLDLVDCGKLADIAYGLKDIAREFGGSPC